MSPDRLRFPRLLATALVACAMTVPALVVHAEGTRDAASSDDPWEARMRDHLASAPPGAVDAGAVRVTRQESLLVGDVPLRFVEATVNAEGKVVGAYFDERDGRFVGRYLPDYREASGQKVGWTAVQALRADPSADLDVFVDFEPPAGFVRGDEIQKADLTDPELARRLGPDVASLVEAARSRALTKEEATRFADAAYAAQMSVNGKLLGDMLSARAAQLRAVRGVESVSVPDHPFAPRLHARASAAGVAAIAASPHVLAVDALDAGGGGWESNWNFAVAKDAAGGTAANNAGLWGSGNKIASVDTGISSVWLNGLDCIAYAMYGVWGNSPGATDPAPGGHGTAIAWVIDGGKTYGGTQCTGEPHGITRDATLYNAKIVNTDGTYSQAAYEGGVGYSANTWQVNVGTSSAGQPVVDTGSHWMSRYLDYTVYNTNRIWTGPPGNYRTEVRAPGGAYNALVVGAMKDQGTVTRTDDALYDVAVDKATPQVAELSDHRRKPDVVMPGATVRLPKNDGTWGDASGTSFAVPFAAAGMNLQSTSYTGREKKCEMIVSAPQTGWSTGWGWGFPNVNDARQTDGLMNTAVANGAHSYWGTINVPAGKTLYATLVWWREMSAPSTVTRFSDLDLHITNSARTSILAYSWSSYDSIEKTTYKNTGASTVSVDVRAHGYSVPGGTSQPFTLCWDIR